MRIALFTDTYPPQINGVAASTYILRNELEKHGHQVYVVTTYKGSGKHQWDDDHKILQLAGLQLKFLYGYVMTSPFHVFALEEIRKLDLDVIHAQTEFGAGIFARICAKQLHIPLVSTYHTTYEDYTHYVNFINSRKVDEIVKVGVAKVSRLYGDSSMEVIAPSVKTKQMLEGYHVRRDISVIPTGLELEQFEPKHFPRSNRHEMRASFGFKDEDHLVVYVGRLAQEKALDIVVRGFKNAKDRGMDIKLMIVGGGPDYDPLNALIKEMHMESDIILTGPKPREEIPAIYNCADAFISASLSETQGMTFIEALASGIPLFARKDEVLQELLIEGKTGWYFTDENDLPDQLDHFLHLSDEERKNMSKECLQRVKPYSSETFYQNVIRVYGTAIDQYHHQYTIVDVKAKDSIVQLYLISNEKEELRLQVSMDNYYNMGMRKDGILTSKQVEDLQYREKGALAYQSCLRKLSVRDRSRKEIYDWLTQNTECDIRTVNRIVYKLEDKGYINDERFTVDEIARLKAAHNGSEKIIQTLQKKGIPYELITEKLNEGDDDENESARKYAQKLLNSCKEGSVRKAKNYVYVHLVSRGYPKDISKDVSEKLDYTDLEDAELDHLSRCAMKAKKRYEKKYSGSELKNHVYRYCVAQGYQAQDVYVTIDEMRW